MCQSRLRTIFSGLLVGLKHSRTYLGSPEAHTSCRSLRTLYELLAGQASEDPVLTFTPNSHVSVGKQCCVVNGIVESCTDFSIWKGLINDIKDITYCTNHLDPQWTALEDCICGPFSDIEAAKGTEWRND